MTSSRLATGSGWVRLRQLTTSARDLLLVAPIPCLRNIKRCAVHASGLARTVLLDMTENSFVAIPRRPCTSRGGVRGRVVGAAVAARSCLVTTRRAFPLASLRRSNTSARDPRRRPLPRDDSAHPEVPIHRLQPHICSRRLVGAEQWLRWRRSFPQRLLECACCDVHDRRRASTPFS